MNINPQGIKSSTHKEIDPDQLDNLFDTIGWRRRGKERWESALTKSSFVYSIWDRERLVGLGRILEDGVMCMFYDVGVHPDYQGLGLGTEIMNALIEQVKNKKYASVGLFAWERNPNNIPFYKKFGFEQTHTGMELIRLMERE